ncbi:MAG: PAN domain-containing protein [Myxococcales bacterium]|nr:PAN domain-containing protein [Myxococcales bacterium]
MQRLSLIAVITLLAADAAAADLVQKTSTQCAQIFPGEVSSKDTFKTTIINSCKSCVANPGYVYILRDGSSECVDWTVKVITSAGNCGAMADGCRQCLQNGGTKYTYTPEFNKSECAWGTPWTGPSLAGEWLAPNDNKGKIAQTTNVAGASVTGYVNDSAFPYPGMLYSGRRFWVKFASDCCTGSLPSGDDHTIQWSNGTTWKRKPSAAPPVLESGVDRPGADLYALDLAEARPELCAAACLADAKCAAFTYANPGLAGPSARCFLKSSAAAAVANPGCTSGLRSPVKLEPNTDRAGSDYKTFDIAENAPAQCAVACQMDSQCAAFTFAAPGVLGPKGRCFLKSSSGSSTPNPCCTSGVRSP